MMSCLLQIVCQSMRQIVQADSTQDTAYHASVLTSTDWSKGQSGVTVISRVKEIVDSGQKPSNRTLANDRQDVKRYLKDWNKLKVKDHVLYRTTPS